MAQPEEERISKLEGSFNILVKLTEELRDEVRSLKEELLEQINDLRNSVGNLEKTLTAHENRFATKDSLHKLELKVASIESNYANLKSKIDNVEKTSSLRYAELEKEMQELKKTLNNTNQLINNTQKTLSAISASINTQDEISKTTLMKISATSALVSALISLLAFVLMHHR